MASAFFFILSARDSSSRLFKVLQGWSRIIKYQKKCARHQGPSRIIKVAQRNHDAVERSGTKRNDLTPKRNEPFVRVSQLKNPSSLLSVVNSHYLALSHA